MPFSFLHRLGDTPVSTSALLSVALALVVLANLGAIRLFPTIAGDATGNSRRLVLVGLGIVLLFAGTRLTIMSGQVSWVPYLDQWDGELMTLVQRFAHGTFTWGDFAAPHNDHRITTTRFASLVAVVVNGEWDNRVLVVAGYFVPALCFVLLALLAHRALGPRLTVILLLVALAPALLICDWENLVIGFQLQFYLLLLSSLVAITLLPRVADDGLAGVAGFIAALLAGMSMGSGLLSFGVACVGLWVSLQGAAFAYGRAKLLPLVSARYTTLLQWSAISCTAALLLWWQAAPSKTQRIVRATLALAGAATLIACFVWRSEKFYRPYLVEFVTQTQEREARVRTFARDNDPRVFTEVEFPHKPYVIDERMVSMLRDPVMAPFWPAPVRRDKVRLTDPAAFAQIESGPLTLAARGALRSGSLFIVGGLALIGGVVYTCRRRPSLPPTTPDSP